MAIPNLGPKAVAGEMTDNGVVKLFLDDASIVDVPMVVVPGGSIVDNSDGTITITIPDP